jgi:hypothetical protein
MRPGNTRLTKIKTPTTPVRVNTSSVIRFRFFGDSARMIDGDKDKQARFTESVE